LILFRFYFIQIIFITIQNKYNEETRPRDDGHQETKLLCQNNFFFAT